MHHIAMGVDRDCWKRRISRPVRAACLVATKKGHSGELGMALYALRGYYYIQSQ